MHLRSRDVLVSLKRLPWRPMGRWWITGIVFYFAGIGSLYIFVQMWRVPLWAATFISAEISIVLRFLINDRWVFSHHRPSWRRLWQYHLASAAGAGIWWSVSNVLPRFGINYLVAATAGTACAVFFSMASNFLWIWRKRSAHSSALRAPDAENISNPVVT